MMWERVRAWWASLSGSQQFLIGAGVPTAAVAAVVGNLRDRGAQPDDEGEGEGDAPSGPRQPLNPAPDNIDLLIALNRMRQALIDAFNDALDRFPDPDPDPAPAPPPPSPNDPPPPSSEDPILIHPGEESPPPGGGPGFPPFGRPFPPPSFPPLGRVPPAAAGGPGFPPLGRVPPAAAANGGDATPQGPPGTSPPGRPPPGPPRTPPFGRIPGEVPPLGRVPPSDDPDDPFSDPGIPGVMSS